MATTLEAPTDFAVSESDVADYVRLGHTGFVFYFRAANAGNEPDPHYLQQVAELAEHQKCSKVIRVVKAVVDMLT